MNAEILKNTQYTKELNGSDRTNSFGADVTLWPPPKIPFTNHAPNPPGNPTTIVTSSNQPGNRSGLKLRASRELTTSPKIIAAVRANLPWLNPPDLVNRFSRRMGAGPPFHALLGVAPPFRPVLAEGGGFAPPVRRAGAKPMKDTTVPGRDTPTLSLQTRERQGWGNPRLFLNTKDGPRPG